MPDDTTLPAAIRDEIHLSLDELARRGAQRMLAAALQAEVDDYIRRYGGQDDKGRALVVRNGHARERTILCGAGELQVRAPRVHDRRPKQRFTSRILPPYMRKSPRLEEAVPVLYLRGLSTGDFHEALSALLGAEAVAGFSATTVTRLLQVWQDEYKAWRKRPLGTTAYTYIWADGVHFGVRLEEDKRLAALVVIGVRPDGRKEVLALEDGYRESTESWTTLLRDLKHRGLPAPKLAVADGALGFWAALRDIYPETDEQRCWVHKLANVLDKLPKRLQSRAKSHLHEIMRAPDRATALEELVRFQEEYEAKYPKAVACLTKDADQLFTFMDYPGAHWLHLRSTNAIESTFATVKARTRVTKGAGSREAGLAMAFKLLTQAEKRWRRVNSSHLVALVQTGVKFPDGQTRILPDMPADSVVNLPVDATSEMTIHNI
jgi:putative transposase